MVPDIGSSPPDPATRPGPGQQQCPLTSLAWRLSCAASLTFDGPADLALAMTDRE